MQTDRKIPVEDTGPDQMDTLEEDILSDQMDISEDDTQSDQMDSLAAGMANLQIESCHKLKGYPAAVCCAGTYIHRQQIKQEEESDDMQTDRTILVEETGPDQMDMLEEDILSDQMDISDDDTQSDQMDSLEVDPLAPGITFSR